MNSAKKQISRWQIIKRELTRIGVKRARKPLQREVEKIHRELHAYYKTNKNLPCDDEPIWRQLSEIHEGFIRLNWRMMARKLDLSEPSELKTLAEKLEWLKFNDHREELVCMADKVEARRYVLSKTNDPNLLNRLYGVYDSAYKIPLEELPEKFVIKANHWCGGNFICRHKYEFTSEVRTVLNGYMNRVYATTKAEWPYWHIKPQLLVEEYLEDQFNQLVDYQAFCFNGEPRFIMVCAERFSEAGMHRLFFDLDWQLMPFTDHKYPPIPDGENFPRPESLSKMLDYSRCLAQDTAFVRADFYDLFGECRFSELDIYPEAGVGCRFWPDEWNVILGDWLHLPEPNRNPRLAFFYDRLGK